MTDIWQVPITRWACDKGHFIAESSMQSEDSRDDSTYYGISTRRWATCKVCGVIDEPHLVEIGTQEIAVEPITERPWEHVLSDDSEPGDLG